MGLVVGAAVAVGVGVDVGFSVDVGAGVGVVVLLVEPCLVKTLVESEVLTNWFPTKLY